MYLIPTLGLIKAKSDIKILWILWWAFKEGKDFNRTHIKKYCYNLLFSTKITQDFCQFQFISPV
jgi:hypothetical protein